MVKKNFINSFVFVSLVVVFLDQFIKYLIAHFKPNWNFGILKIYFLTNTGAGFSILAGRTSLLALISLFVILGVIFFYKKIPQEKTPQILFALFLGGATGNFLDRAFKGYVIDYISLSFWPSFNIADAAISIAAFGLIIYSWQEEKSKKRNKK